MIFYIIVTAGCMITAGIIGCKHPNIVQKWLTACVGSYIFMRGWTYYLGGFPSEMEMYDYMAHENSDPLAFTGMFWFYVGLFVGGAFLFVYLQGNYEYLHAEGDEKAKQNKEKLLQKEHGHY